MATWTDSPLKDFLRHPIGYLSGERTRERSHDESMQEQQVSELPQEAPVYSEELTKAIEERKGDRFAMAEEAALSVDFDFGRTLAFIREGADIHYESMGFDSAYNSANDDQKQAMVAALPPQSRLNHAVTVQDIDEFKKALRQGADVFAEVQRGTAYEFRNGGRPDEDSIKLRGPEAVLVSSVAEFVEQESRIIKEHDENGLKQGIDPDRRQFAAQLAEVVNPLLAERERMELSPRAHTHEQVDVDPASIQLFDGANLSPEAADLYKASLSRNVQDTNDALDRIGAMAEPEQQAYNKQADPSDLKLDRAGEAAYQQGLRASGQAITDNINSATLASDVPQVGGRYDESRYPYTLMYEQSHYLPLPYAAEAGNIDACKKLLADGQTQDAVDLALHHVLGGGKEDVEVVKLLLDAGASPHGGKVVKSVLPGESPLNSAVKSGNAEIVSTLLAAGAEPHPIDHTHAPLDMAARLGDVEIVSILLKAGANPNESDWDADWTPLHSAAKYGNDKVASLLLESGADLNARTNDGDTPLHLAQQPWNVTDGEEKFYKTVSVLVDAGADIRTPNKKGETPLDRLKGTYAGSVVIAANRALELNAALPQVVEPAPPSKSEALAAAWSSTQPTKENLQAAKPAQVAPSLTTSKRARF